MRYDREDESKLEYAAMLGLEAGDYVYASYAVGSLINLSYVRDDWGRMFKVNRNHLQLMEHTKEDLVFKNALIYMDMAKKWQSPHADVFSITDGRTDDNEALFLQDVMKDEGKAVTLYQYYTYKTQMYYLFGRFPEAVNVANQANPYEGLSAHAPHLSEHHFYEALSIAAAWEDLPAGEKAECFRRLKRRFRQFKAWDRMSPENFRHKCLLIRAEMARLQGKENDIIDLYEQSVHFARERNYVQYQAVACERAASYHLQKGRESIASGYLHEAFEAYGAWGAQSKQIKLREQYPEWLQTPKNTDRTIVASPMDEHANRQAPDKPGSLTDDGRNPDHREDVLREVDLTAIVKASLSLSQGMDLKQILRKLMTIIVEAAEVQKGCLIVQRNGDLRVENVMDANGKWADASKPLAENGDVPASLVQYCSRLEETVQLKDASKDELFLNDPYIARNRITSVCCIPLSLQEQFSGILYLELGEQSPLLADNRIETLRVMGSQALFVWKLSDFFGEKPDSSFAPAAKSQETSVDALTDRELEVLNLMALGMTNKEIAFQLGVTAGTVKVHVHNIFSKLNVNRRTKAISEARRKNML